MRTRLRGQHRLSFAENYSNAHPAHVTRYRSSASLLDILARIMSKNRTNEESPIAAILAGMAALMWLPSLTRSCERESQRYADLEADLSRFTARYEAEMRRQAQEAYARAGVRSALDGLHNVMAIQHRAAVSVCPQIAQVRPEDLDPELCKQLAVKAS